MPEPSATQMPTQVTSSKRLGRQCVFCGQAPDGETLEHVIPDWLIKLTGPVGRKARFGVDWRTGKIREFAFGRLRFPACRACNERYGQLLENRTSDIVKRLMAGASLTTDDMNRLLDWLDKVRVGMWLGYMALSGNRFGIEPKFHISDRIARHDRALLIYRVDECEPRLLIAGTESPVFEHSPVCFGLLANNVGLVNVSSAFLLAKRLGVPYPVEKRLDERGDIVFTLSAGTGKLRRPVIAYYSSQPCTCVMQLVTSQKFTNDESIRDLYADAHTRRLLDVGTSHRGKIIVDLPSGLLVCEESTAVPWCPETTEDPSLMWCLVSRTVYDWQLKLLEEVRATRPAGVEWSWVGPARMYNRMALQRIKAATKSRLRNIKSV